MKLKDYKKQAEYMDMLGGMVKSLEYSEQNPLSSDRKSLHRNMIIPMMNQEYENYKEYLKGLEEGLINMGFTDPDEIDVDELFGEDE